MRRLLWVVAGGLFTGCGGDVEGGVTHVCLDGPPSAADGMTSELGELRVSGTFVEVQEGPVGDFALHACWMEVDQALVFTDGDGELWRVGFSLRDAAGQSTVPSLDLVPGAEVALLVRLVQSFGVASGFAVTDDEGLVLAVEQGTWGPALLEGDLPIAVDRGERVAVAPSDCGRQGEWELVFSGDEQLALRPYGEASLAFEGRSYTAVAAVNTDWVGQVSCTDVAGNTSWALFRDPS